MSRDINNKVSIANLELLQQIANAVVRPFFVKGLDRRYLVANESFARSVDLPLDQIIGKTDHEIGTAADLVPSIWQQDDQAIAAASCSGAANRFPEVTLNTEAGDVRTPLFDDGGNVFALATLVDDRNELLQLQQSLQKKLKVREEQLSVLHDLMAKMMAHHELEPLLQQITRIMISYTLADVAIIFLVNETGDAIEIAASAGERVSTLAGHQPTKGKGLTGVVWADGETRFLKNCEDNAVTRKFWPPGTQLLGVPLKIDDVVIGVVLLGAPSSVEDLSRSSTLVNNLAALASLAIANTQALVKSNFEIKRSRGLSEISNLLPSFTDVDEMLLSVSRILADAMDFMRCSFFRMNDDGAIYAKTTWAATDNGVVAIEPLSPELTAKTLCAWVFKNKESATAHSNEHDPREPEEIHLLRADMGIGSTILMPVIVDDSVFAVLIMCRCITQRDFDENELNLLASVVQQLATAIKGFNMSKALHHQAFHDSLTDLPNRRYLEDQLKDRLRIQSGTELSSALMFLDLDGFKAVNDTHGHAVGDQLLKLVALRLKNCLSSEDLIARIGGDEFAVIISPIESREQTIRIAERLRKSLLDPFNFNGTMVNVGASIGICFFPTDGDTVDVLLRSADEAMYQAKASGKNNVVCFQQSMTLEARNRVLIESALLQALQRDEFLLYYQPQVDPVTGTVRGVEALIRWQHPELGLISPAEFIPTAESNGIINDIGSWALNEALGQIVNWLNTPLANLRMGVNIAASQFIQGDFSARVIERIQHFGIEPAQLEIELTESIVMQDVEYVARIMAELRAAGVSIALDDFGTGYSSLSYLQELPLDTLKIDRAFVARLDDEKSEYSLVNTIMLLASGLGLKTIAEGVETSQQLSKIVDLGCPLVQGYYYSKPCSATELETVVQAIEREFAFKKAG